MTKILIAILFIACSLFSSCSPTIIIQSNDLLKNKMVGNAFYVINQPIDLKCKTVTLPENCTLAFKGQGNISNGVLNGMGTKIEYNHPFIGENVIINGCVISGKSTIRDNEVFISVTHSQKEIQTLFDISGGRSIVFSKGLYVIKQRIDINNNIDASFNGSEIRLDTGEGYAGECFYMEPWVNKRIDYIKIRDLTIRGRGDDIINRFQSRRCIQLFYVSDVEFRNVEIDNFYGGPEEYKKDASDLLDKTRIGTCAIAIMKYDRCVIDHCKTNDINKEIFWCVPNNNQDNIVYFTNNKSTCSSPSGSASFFTLLDGRCIVKNNCIYNYNGSAINAFCYDSEISGNAFYDGKRSVAIDLSEGTMYRARNVSVHHNVCYNSKGLVSAYGENINIYKNRWEKSRANDSDRCTVVTISSRGPRVDGSRYIGCENNSNQDNCSEQISIKNNSFLCKGTDKIGEYRCASLSGVEIVFSDNNAVNFNVPVVQFLDGNHFAYNGNVLTDSMEGSYAELLINSCKGIEINNNTFSRNNVFKNHIYTVQIWKAGGILKYHNNNVSRITRTGLAHAVYSPCYVDDYSELNSAEIYVDKKEQQMETRLFLDSKKVFLKTNVKNQ